MGRRQVLFRWEGKAAVAERCGSVLQTVIPHFVCLEAVWSGFGLLVLVMFVCLAFCVCDVFC